MMKISGLVAASILTLSLILTAQCAHADECDTYIGQIVVSTNAKMTSRKGKDVAFKAGPYGVTLDCKNKSVAATTNKKYPTGEYFLLLGSIGKVVTKKPIDDVGAAAMICRDKAYTESAHVGQFQLPGISIFCISLDNEFTAIVTPEKS